MHVLLGRPIIRSPHLHNLWCHGWPTRRDSPSQD
jgi:hypothetical protein